MSGTANFVPSSVIEIRSSLSLKPSQTFLLPFVQPASTNPTSPPPAPHVARLLTSSPSSETSLFLVSTPIDRATAATAGSTVWSLYMKPWGEQVDELVEAGSYSEALALLESIDEALLPVKVCETTVEIQRTDWTTTPPCRRPGYALSVVYTLSRNSVRVNSPRQSTPSLHSTPIPRKWSLYTLNIFLGGLPCWRMIGSHFLVALPGHPSVLRQRRRLMILRRADLQILTQRQLRQVSLQDRHLLKAPFAGS